jgi:hypothetical protein
VQIFDSAYGLALRAACAVQFRGNCRKVKAPEERGARRTGRYVERCVTKGNAEIAEKLRSPTWHEDTTPAPSQTDSTP